MSEPRRPAAFRIEPQTEAKPARREPEHKHAETARKPRAIAKSDVAIVMPAEIDVFADGEVETSAPPLAVAPRRRSQLGAIFPARWHPGRWRSACGPMR